jgi:3D-(3,5/4)-trihydroxycyclohexane-1,2-dione acylhydrolase (decyclizing)
MVHIETDPLVSGPSSESWWDVPVSEVAQLDSTIQARKSYETGKQQQRLYLTGEPWSDSPEHGGRAT